MIPEHFPRPVRAVIFDFDETMIDLEAQHTYASEELCRVRGDDYARMPEEFRRGSGRRVIDDVHQLREFFGWSESVDALFEERQRYFDAACGIGVPLEEPLPLMAGVVRLVHALHASGVTLAVTSSAVGSSIDAILRQAGLREHFALIVDGSAVTNGKPDPEAYLVTLQLLGCDAHESIVIEDSHVGVLAAKRAGIFCIAVRNPKAGRTRTCLRPIWSCRRWRRSTFPGCDDGRPPAGGHGPRRWFAQRRRPVSPQRGCRGIARVAVCFSKTNVQSTSRC